MTLREYILKLDKYELDHILAAGLQHCMRCEDCPMFQSCEYKELYDNGKYCRPYILESLDCEV